MEENKIAAKKKYYTGRNDYVFLSLITDFPEYVKDIIQTVFGISLNNIHYENTKQAKQNMEERGYYLDIIITSDNFYINMEYNNYWNSSLMRRNFIYAAKILVSSFKVGEKDFDHKLLQVNFIKGHKDLDFDIDIEEIYSRKQGNISNDMWKNAKINLDKVKEIYYNDKEKLTNYLPIVVWGLEENELIELSKESEYVRLFKNRLDALNDDENRYRLMSIAEEKEIYERALRKEGKLEGIEEGKLEGIEKGKLEVIKNLLKGEISMEALSQSTGFSIEELEKLKED